METSATLPKIYAFVEKKAPEFDFSGSRYKETSQDANAEDLPTFSQVKKTDYYSYDKVVLENYAEHMDRLRRKQHVFSEHFQSPEYRNLTLLIAKLQELENSVDYQSGDFISEEL